MQVSEKLRPLFVRWQFPNTNTWICMESLPLLAIPARTLRYLEKEKPCETGGLLWGKVIQDGAKRLLLISQADFVSCETESFNSSPTDLLALSAALERPKAGLKPIGYFRSSPPSQTDLREQEKAFFERSFKGSDSILLIVMPVEDGTCAARLFLREHGRLEQSNYLEVPLLRASSHNGEGLVSFEEHETAPTFAAKRQRPDVPAKATETVSWPDEFPDDTQELDRDDPDTWQYGSRSKGAIWGHYAAVAGVAAVLGLSAYAFRSQLFPSRTDQSRTLGSSSSDSNIALQVSRRSDGQLDLTWNKDLPSLQSAHRAVLSIKDGFYSREIQLGDDQLRSGKLVYFPEGADIQFHLEIFVDPMRSIGESVRVISHETYPSIYGNTLPLVEPGRLLKPPLRRAVPAVAVTTPGTTRNPTQPAPNTVAKESAPSAVAVASSPNPAENKLPPQEPPSGRPQQQVIPKNTVQANQVTLPVFSKPAGASDTATTSIPAGLPLQFGHELPVKSETAVRTTPIPAAQPPLKTEPLKPVNTPPSTSAPGPVTPGQIASSPPQPLKKVAPNTKPFGTSLITSDLDLDVLVNVDVTGKVIDAHVINSGARQHSLLMAEAVEAARRWRFAPAQRGGAKVPGTYLIQFRFRSSK